jgi:TM2 domain-containing membrane protein YozV
LGQLRIKRTKNRLLTVLFAFALPGAGHMYTGQHPKGLLLIAAFLLDLTAIVRLADSDGGSHLLLIVYLGIMLPVFYFISVFDSLQSTEAVDHSPVALSRMHGILLLTAGSFMLILVKPPEAILPWMNELAELCVGPILIIASITLLLRSRKGSVSMFKLGRFTAAALVLTVGALLLWDQIQGRNDISLLGQWWPVIFILLGLEVILFSVKFKGMEKKLRLDVAGGMVALAITLTAYVVTQYADIPFRWLDQFNVDLNGSAEYGEEKGFRYDKAIIKVPLDEEASLIRIVNPNGQVTVRSGDVQEIELLTAVWVDLTDKAEADAVAEQSTVKINPGAEMTLEAKGQSFGANGSRKPRMNMIVTVPMSLSDRLEVEEAPASSPLTLESAAGLEKPNTTGSPIDSSVQMATDALEVPDTSLDDMSEQTPETEEEPKSALKLKVESGNGSVDIKSLTLPGGLDIRSNSGLIAVSNINGSVSVKGNNGGINVTGITGDSSLETKNGTITAASIQGKLFANTLNGSLEIKEIEGDIEAETKNGKIKMDGAGASVKADTLNGSIELSSAKVGGDWDLDSSVGEIKLAMPMDGHFTVNGSVTFGNITTELPLEVSKKTIRGTMGKGTYRIQINATNSIAIRQFGLS